MFLKIIALQLSFDVHPLEFSVEEPDVVALPLLPQQHVLVTIRIFPVSCMYKVSDFVPPSNKQVFIAISDWSQTC